MKKTTRQFLLAAVTTVIFVILLSSMDLSAMGQAVGRAHPGYLILAGLLSLFFPLLCAIRWHWIVLRLGTNLGVWQSYKLIMAAWPLSTVTPAKSGDLVKVLFLKETLSYSHTTGVVLAERIVDVVSLALLALFAGLWVGSDIAVAFGAGVLALALGGLVLLNTSLIYLVPGKWKPKFGNMIEAGRQIYSHVPTFAGVFVVTLLNWYLSVLQTWLCYKAFAAEVPMGFVMAILPVTIFVGLLPLTIAGMGTRDTAIIYLFLPYASREVSLAVGILYSVFGYWLLTLLGLPFMKGAFEGSIRGLEGKNLKETVYQEKS